MTTAYVAVYSLSVCAHLKIGHQPSVHATHAYVHGIIQ